MVHDPKHLQTVFETAAPPDMEVTFRAMFGGILAYAGGKPLASLSDVGLALKVFGDDHKALMATAGANALQYDVSQPVSKSYVVVGEALLDDKDALRAWIVRAADGLKAQPVKAKKKKPQAAAS